MSDALQFYWKDVWSHTSSMTSTVRTRCHMIESWLLADIRQQLFSDSGFLSSLSRALVAPPGSRGLSARLDPRHHSPCEPSEPARSAPPLPSPEWAEWSHVTAPPGSSAACRTVSEATGDTALQSTRNRISENNTNWWRDSRSNRKDTPIPHLKNFCSVFLCFKKKKTKGTEVKTARKAYSQYFSRSNNY